MSRDIDTYIDTHNGMSADPSSSSATPPSRVTVAVPVYNEVKWLPQCIQSIREQTLSDIEILILDDGSHPECSALCDHLASADARIRVIHKPNEGLGVTLNHAILHARSPYLLFVDADDVIDQDMCMHLYSIASAEDADVVMSPLTLLYPDGRRHSLHTYSSAILSKPDEIRRIALEMIAALPHTEHTPLPFHLHRGADRSVAMSAKTGLYRRELLLTHGIRFRSERDYICEDLLFNIDVLSAAHCVAVSDRALYLYRQTPLSLSRTADTDRWSKVKRMYTMLLNTLVVDTPLFRDIESEEDLRLRCWRFLAGYARQAIAMAAKAPLPRRDRCRLIAAIIHDPIWEEYRRVYPIHHLPRRQRLMQKAMLRDMTHTLYMVCRALR